MNLLIAKKDMLRYELLQFMSFKDWIKMALLSKKIKSIIEKTDIGFHIKQRFGQEYRFSSIYELRKTYEMFSDGETHTRFNQELKEIELLVQFKEYNI